MSRRSFSKAAELLSIGRAALRARYSLMTAGLVCGVVWEMWNFWAGAKRKYTVPILPNLKILEMPVAGYAGFPAFAVECFAMYATVRFLIWRTSARPISI